MPRVGAIVFDMDGTLLDSTATVPAAYAAAIEEICGRRVTHDEIVAAYAAGPASALISQFIGRDADDADVECWHRHLETLLPSTYVYAGIAQVLAVLAASGTHLGVFSGATVAPLKCSSLTPRYSTGSTRSSAATRLPGSNPLPTGCC